MLVNVVISKTGGSRRGDKKQFHVLMSDAVQIGTKVPPFQ
jgi:hypothetical protein